VLCVTGGSIVFIGVENIIFCKTLVNPYGVLSLDGHKLSVWGRECRLKGLSIFWNDGSQTPM
jgi:hypothetical protein